MRWAVATCVAVLLCWALSGDWLAKRRITAPMVMVAGGALLGIVGLVVDATSTSATETLDLKILDAVLGGPAAERVVELVLAVLLFVDSFATRRGVLGHELRVTARLLLLALPLSILLGAGLGLLLFPGTSWAVILVLVCIVVPTDLAPSAGLLRDARLPERVRDVLNIESGYNDGFVAPVFVFALTLAGSSSHASSPEEALREAVPASLIALAVGAALGLTVGWVMKRAVAAGVTSSHALRYGIVGIPLLTYALASEAHGNGFVAAFVAGVAFRAARGDLAHREVMLAEEVAVLGSHVMWFVMGVCTALVIQTSLTWQTVLFALAALTVMRVIPVLISLTGSTLSRDERWLIALLGPRGVATIVFALLAFNDFGHEQARTLALSVMCLTVVGSLFLHGLGAPALAARHHARTGRTEASVPAKPTA